MPNVMTPEDGGIRISAALLGGTAEEESGSLGQATFEVLAGLAGQTSVRLSFAQFGHTSGELALSIGPGRATVVIGGTPSGASPNFDGDGWVDFKDFIASAKVYGGSRGDDKQEAKFDLNSGGEIGFRDFIAFAWAYGQAA